ncbi:MAG: hypothetical protein HQM02_09730 [Magnetococcales bacterium]|nr:hypothetical protein [Magnetococcales bacterium]
MNHVASHLAGWHPPAGRIRVGFLSEWFVTHTIGRLYQGLMRHLDRDRFQVVLIHAHLAGRDAFSARLEAMVDEVLLLPPTLEAQQERVAAARLEILFYPDIGMSQATTLLAYARLAPVQVVSWGHPDTTGLDSMDYFVSSTLIEPDDGEEAYSEGLIRLSRLPCCYPMPVTPMKAIQRRELGLPGSGTLYGCPQTLFKFHPDFDGVLAEIATGDPEGRIVLLEGNVSGWSALLRARWAATHPVLLERVIFLPHQSHERFLALLACVDLLLDPVHFGSGNTFYEAMAFGTPCVTWPGRFMRGRIVAGAYRQMGVADPPVVARIQEYAPLALALGRDAKRRKALQKALLQRSHTLFSDRQVVRELERFFVAAVEAAGRKEKLPGGWTPAS